MRCLKIQILKLRGKMPTYADELRRLADLLDKDFSRNILDVCVELSNILRLLLSNLNKAVKNQ